MKNRKLISIILTIVLGVVIYSCSKDDYETYDPEKQEQDLLKEYIEYLTANDFDVDTTENGVFYVVYTEGEGATPQYGDSVSVAYNGYIVGGSRFDSSGDTATNGYYKYQHGVTSIIPGWEEGIETIKKGGTSLIIIPSKLAYGSYGSYDIAPYTPIQFEIYVHDIVPN